MSEEKNANVEDNNAEETEHKETNKSSDEAKKPYRIEHDRENCISCAACVSINEKDWYMNEEDTKSDLLGSEKFEKDNSTWERKEISQEEFELNKEAAEACPVNVIHIIDQKKEQNGAGDAQII